MPWRIHETRGLCILLITSRETKRWVIPKGGRMAGKMDAEAASIEAVEEAGVLGEVHHRPIGRFRYLKVLGPDRTRKCVVSVFPIRVSVQLAEWPEAHERRRMWMSADDAARAVQETDLAALILSFARTTAAATPF